MSNDQRQPDKAADNTHGVTESQQDRQQDDVAKQRPGVEDLKVDNEQNRRPKGNAGQGK
ncbi:hypothetical protein [Xanthomonas sp. 3075]|uniref:hypothetical protein n=1 Tax=Xanthomonas sp. 3075 TaxID=3035315 RepID=UPI001614B4C3|nr:hypothetical protein [Xanthomonas sp. 3075]MBB4132867.1 hypothetical protein [Xanthomonas sp. 3075]